MVHLYVYYHQQREPRLYQESALYNIFLLYVEDYKGTPFIFNADG